MATLAGEYCLNTPFGPVQFTKEQTDKFHQLSDAAQQIVIVRCYGYTEGCWQTSNESGAVRIDLPSHFLEAWRWVD